MAQNLAWPRERNVAELIAFYGAPVRHGAADPAFERDNIVDLVPPYAMRFSWGPPVTTLKFYKKCRDAFGEALLAVKKLYGTQQNIEAHRLHLTGGSFVVRLKRGSRQSWSIHAYGAAIDIDPRPRWAPPR